MRFDLASLRYSFLRDRQVARESPSGQQSTALARVFSIRGFDRLHLEVADLQWNTGERSVETLEYHDGPTQMKRLTGKGRLTVRESDGAISVDLRLLTVKPNELGRWNAQLLMCDQARLNEAAGVSSFRLLREAGATTIGTRSKVEGDHSSSKNHLCAKAPAVEGAALPLVAHAITRILPLQNMAFDRNATHLESEYLVPEEAKDDKGGRLYVVLLDPKACSHKTDFDQGLCPDRGGTCVYVGCTGKPREHRFREHLVGHKSSKWVRHYGIRLMPELWQGTPCMIPGNKYAEFERELGLGLAAQGFCVRGGH